MICFLIKWRSLSRICSAQPDALCPGTFDNMPNVFCSLGCLYGVVQDLGSKDADSWRRSCWLVIPQVNCMVRKETKLALTRHTQTGENKRRHSRQTLRHIWICQTNRKNKYNRHTHRKTNIGRLVADRFASPRCTSIEEYMSTSPLAISGKASRVAEKTAVAQPMGQLRL